MQEFKFVLRNLALYSPIIIQSFIDKNRCGEDPSQWGNAPIVSATRHPKGLTQPLVFTALLSTLRYLRLG